MLRSLRPADAAALFDLLRRHFPEEQALVGYRPEAFERVVRKIFRLDYRIALGFLDLVRRPVVRFFVIEVDGRIAATALLTFAEGIGHVSTVMVDDPYRRRGYAKQLLAACAASARAAHRQYLVLEVLVGNAPARTLYERLGFRALRRLTAGSARLGATPTPRAPAPVRPFRRADAGPLASLATARLPPEVARVLPYRPGDFALSPLVTGGLAAESQAWVLDPGSGPAGFVRATKTELTQAGHVSAPIVRAGTDPSETRALVATAFEWLSARGVPSATAEVSQENVEGRRALEEEGFHGAHDLDTLVLRIAE